MLILEVYIIYVRMRYEHFDNNWHSYQLQSFIFNPFHAKSVESLTGVTISPASNQIEIIEDLT